MKHSYEPVNVRRRLRRKLRNLRTDKGLFLARYLGHAEAERMYANEERRLEAEVLTTFSRRWRRHLAKAERQRARTLTRAAPSAMTQGYGAIALP